MRTDITSIADFSSESNDKFFIDSNVWMYLNSPQYADVATPVIGKYSTFFLEILAKKYLINGKYS